LYYEVLDPNAAVVIYYAWKVFASIFKRWQLTRHQIIPVIDDHLLLNTDTDTNVRSRS